MLKSLALHSANPTVLELPSGESVPVPTYMPRFVQWKGVPLLDTYNTKPVLDADGVPLFAELVIVRLFESEGWDAVWIDSYRGRFLHDWPAPATSYTVPAPQRALLDRISGGRKFPTGCWDVFAWKGDLVAFAEAKRSHKDKLQDSQRRWIAEALNVNVPLSSFFFVEWDFAQAES